MHKSEGSDKGSRSYQAQKYQGGLGLETERQGVLGLASGLSWNEHKDVSFLPLDKLKVRQ